MRDLSSTLLAAQKGSIDPRAKIVLTLGATSHTYEQDRMFLVDHREEVFSQRAKLTFDDHDKVISALALKGYKGVLSYGAKTSAGEEYSACAPLWVIPQQIDSSPGARVNTLNCVLELKGIPDLLDDDKASGFWIPDLADTVKDILGGILGATNSVYSHCKAYTMDVDSEDSLFDVYCPKQSVRVTQGMSRLTALKLFVQYSTCMPLFKADGHIHFAVPTAALVTTWTSPTGFTAGPWTNEASAYDGDTGIGAIQSLDSFGWTDYLELTHAALSCDHVKFYANQIGDGYIDIDVYDSGEAKWVDVYEGTYTELAWVTKDLDRRRTVTKMRMRLYYGGPLTMQAYVYEASFGSDNYDYTYSLTVGDHPFFAKQYRERLVIPNKVTVNSLVGDVPQYSGAAVDPSCGSNWAANTAYAVGDRVEPVTPNDLFTYECTTAGTSHAATEPTWPTTEGETVADGTVVWTTLQIQRRDSFANTRLASEAQGTAIAEAIIAQAQIGSESGAISVPLNLGAEVLDWVKLTDVSQGDTRTGNQGFVHRKLDFRKAKWEMSVGFGGWLGRQGVERSLVNNALGYELGEGAVTNIALTVVTDVGDYLLHQNTGGATSGQTTYHMVCETQIPCYGYLRVKFSLTGYESEESSASAYGKIYRKSVGGDSIAIGTERINALVDPVVYSEDFSGFRPGDLLQLWIKSVTTWGSGGQITGNNMHLYHSGEVLAYSPYFINTL